MYAVLQLLIHLLRVIALSLEAFAAYLFAHVPALKPLEHDVAVLLRHLRRVKVAKKDTSSLRPHTLVAEGIIHESLKALYTSLRPHTLASHMCPNRR